MVSPHTFVDPNKVVRTAIELVRADLVHTATVNRDFQAEFGGGKGATVDVKIPAVLGPARERSLHSTEAIVMDNLEEDTLPVTIDTHVYSAVRLSDGDLTLNIHDFAGQVLRPQTVSVVENLENRTVALLESAPAATGIDAYDPANPVRTFTQVRKQLRDLGLPVEGMFAAVGTKAYADLLEAKAITDASQSDSDNALRNAIAGRVRGFATYESNRLDENAIVFYNRNSFTVAIRAPRVPDGVSFGRSMGENGFALRWIQDYDASILHDRSVVSTFVGGRSMPVKLLNKNGTTSQVVPAVKVDASDPA